MGLLTLGAWRYFGSPNSTCKRTVVTVHMIALGWQPRRSSPFQPCTAMRSSRSICQHQKSWCRCWGLQITFLPMKLLEPTFDLSGTQETYLSQILGNGEGWGSNLIVVLIVSFRPYSPDGFCYRVFLLLMQEMPPVPQLDPWCCFRAPFWVLYWLLSWSWIETCYLGSMLDKHNLDHSSCCYRAITSRATATTTTRGLWGVSHLHPFY